MNKCGGCMQSSCSELCLVLWAQSMCSAHLVTCGFAAMLWLQQHSAASRQHMRMLPSVSYVIACSAWWYQWILACHMPVNLHHNIERGAVQQQHVDDCKASLRRC